MENKSRKKSMLKSAIWRLLGIITLAVVTYAITKSWIQTTLITALHHLSFLIIYYLHERAWLNVSRFSFRKKVLMKTLTYEIILGHMVLSIISWIVTGSWTSVTLITIIYIENKLWMYLAFEWICKKLAGK